jgi:hypothetical protein
MMRERNVTREQACALGLIENVANGRPCDPLDRDLLWDAHGRLLAELERMNAEGAELRAAASQEEGAYRTQVNDAIRERDDARDGFEAASALAMDLANALYREHGERHGFATEHGDDNCGVCALLERARRWAR